jgi:polysaccharide pyruvyl transferase WcaK-like protein/sulfatase maturation enzyme AslB (radical SAM superfamily)
MSIIERLSYLVRSRPYRLEKPVVLQFPVIDICNSQCQMCFIWKNKSQPVVTPDALRKRLSRPLFDRVRTVGLNGGEPTLRKDLGDLTESLFAALPRLRHISIITNAFRVAEVTARIADVGDIVARHRGTLDVMVSLDGVGDLHDRVRRKPGNFARALQLLEILRGMKTVSSIRIGCTVVKDNVYGVHELLDFCRSENLYIKYRLGIPHRRLYTKGETAPFALDHTERVHFTTFLEGLIRHYEPNPEQRYFYRSLIDQLLFHAPRKAGCDWRHRGATLTSRGELLFCAVESDVVAHLEDSDPGSGYFGASARAHLRDILQSKCNDCTHDYAGLPERSVQLAQFGRAVLSKSGLTEQARALYAHSGMQGIAARQRFFRTAKTLAEITCQPRAATSPQTLMICGWYGTETLGDKAILGTVVTGLRAACPSSPITLVSLNPHISEATRGTASELADLSIMSVEEAISRAGEAKMVIFGGGPLMAVEQIVHMRALFRAAAQWGRPKVIAGCGIGPLGQSHHTSAIREVLNLADLRIFRDESSRQRALDLGVPAANDSVSEDPAFAWVLQRASDARRATPGDRTGNPAKRTLTLGLRAFPWSQYAVELGRSGGRAAQARTDAAILEALEGIIRRLPDLRIQPVPMCVNHYGDDDRWYYRNLFHGRTEIVSRLDWSLLGRELPSDKYLAAFASADAVLAMRFHALVFGIGCGIPTVAIDYTMGKGKLFALATAAEVPHHRVGEVDPKRLEEELFARLTGRCQAVTPLQPRFPDVFATGLARILANEHP